jgi:hypothetical protein
MSLFDYKASQCISAEDPPFYALIMAAMRKADSMNLEILKRSFPRTYEEFEKRYWSKGGLLEGERNIQL